jgi:hypothetical protein
MKPITIDTVDHYLWSYEPEWGRGVTCRFRVESDMVASLTKREARRRYSESLRVEMDADFVMDGPTASEVRNALRVLDDTPVRIPFYPGLDDSYLSGWFMAHDDGPANLYWTEDGADKNGRDYIVPSLLGYVESPRFDLVDTNTFTVGLRWKESSAFAERLQVPAQVWTNGPSIGGRTIRRFPLMPDFQGQQIAGKVTVDVPRKSIGFGRESSSEAYPQIGRREPGFSYTLNGTDAAKLLRFYLDMGGPVEPFWLPVWVEECRLAAAIDAADTEIEVTDATALGAHRYLLLLGATEKVVQVTAIAGNVLTLSEAVGADFGIDTLLCTVALSRFASGQLTVKWTAPQLAGAQINFTEVTQEYLTPVGETYGATLGTLPARCFLYTLSHGAEVWRWTSYDQPLNYGGNAFESRPIEHGDIKDGLLGSSQVSLNLRNWTDNPLTRLVIRTAHERFSLVIAQGVPGDPVTGYEVLFRGWLTSPKWDGPWIEALARGSGSLFERRVPRTMMQPHDNYTLFDSANGLVKADWTFTARLSGIAGNVLTFDTISWPGGALPAIGNEYFALGYIERPAAAFERIPIASSTAIAGGELTVTLAHGFARTAPVAPENDWKLIPGYDGLKATAVAKFDNLVNFGGFPYMPKSNPSIIPVKQNNGSSGKK